MQKTMMTKEEVKALIEAGKTLLLAGSESLLADLPKGRWIGGTIPYFMGDEGGTFTESLIQVPHTQKPSPAKITMNTPLTVFLRKRQTTVFP